MKKKVQKTRYDRKAHIYQPINMKKMYQYLGIENHKSHFGRFEVILAAEASGPPPKAIEDVAEKLITKKLLG